MTDEHARFAWEIALEHQLSNLTARYFPALGSPPEIWVVPQSAKGPAWLNAEKARIYVDERVASFQKKTTKILLLHELIHYSLYLQKHPDPDNDRSPDFQRELRRLTNVGAYEGLL